MKEIEFKSKKLVLTKDEREIAKSWGALWTKFGTLERAGRSITLIFGDWSGYRSSQYRITHVDFAGLYKADGLSITGSIKFTDNTFMNVWTKVVSRKDIIEKQFYRKQSYTKLIGDMIRSGKTFYEVGKEN